MNAKSSARMLCALVAVACTFAVAAEKHLRIFALGNLGTLNMPVDAKWRQTGAASAPEIAIEAAAPNRFQLLLTPLPVALGKQQSDDDVRALVDNMAKQTAPQSVEKNLPLTRIAGAEAKGYMFHSTDPAPAPGEFRLMYQGAVAVGTILATFTVLYNDGAEDDAKSALSSIEALRFTPTK